VPTTDHSARDAVPADPEPLGALLRPQSVGVVGISRPGVGKSSVGGMQVLTELAQGAFSGPVYPIHPEATSFGSLEAYSSLAALPEVPDVVVVARPAAAVIELAGVAGALGVKGLVVMSAGFGELGTDEGLALDTQLGRIADEYGLLVCGPNSLGLINAHSGAYLANFPPLELGPVIPGGLAVVSHSGAIAGSLIGLANDLGVGLSYVISSGNELRLTAADYLRELAGDDSVTAVSLYLEGATDARDLIDAVETVTAACKPVTVLKVGESPGGARAALSHTAKIAGEQALYRGALRQAGASIAESLEDLVSLPVRRANRQAAAPRRAAVLSLSGGLGGVVADELSRQGIEVPQLAAHTQASLDKLGLPLGGSSNPVDTAGATQRDPDALLTIARIVAADTGVDVVVLALPCLFQSTAKKMPQRLTQISDALDKLLVVIWLAGRTNQANIAEARSAGVVCYETSRSCARALVATGEFAKHVNSPANARTVGELSAVAWPNRDDAPPQGGWLSELETKVLLRRYGLSGVREELVTSAHDTGVAADRIGYPIVLKVVSADIVHKAAVGGVRLGVTTPQEASRGFDEVLAAVRSTAPEARIDGILVSEMVDHRLEFLVGTYQDEAFGPVLAFGRGGSKAEQLREVQLRLLPVTLADCVDAVTSLLAGLRNPPGPAETALLIDVVRGVAELAEHFGPALLELDVNPVAVTNQGLVVALDAVARIEESA